MPARSEGFWIVRHGCAGKKGSRPERPDDERPLDPAGVLQAELLCQILAADRPTRLVSSPAARCVQTLEPLAEALGLVIEVSPDLGGHAGADALASALGRPQHGVVLCTHGEAMRPIVGRFAELHVTVDDGVSRDRLLLKGTAWRLDRTGRGWALHVVSPAPRRECPDHRDVW